MRTARDSYHPSTPYLYNGKEIDRMHGANWYDYGLED